MPLNVGLVSIKWPVNKTNSIYSLLFQKFGVQPSAEEIKSRGENCPICQDDYQDPVMLSCKVSIPQKGIILPIIGPSDCLVIVKVSDI
jgi:hypothetical protein